MVIDHVTLRTLDLCGTRDFMMQVFDLVEGRRPIEISGIAGHWLYSDGEPLVHIIESHGSGLLRVSEFIDHVGFRMGDYEAFKAKLEYLGIAYRTMQVPSLNERRIFLRTPGGQLLETVFSNPVEKADREM
ncbi:MULTISPECIES: glyoxalase [unclassified Pseudomonas]|jgi:catechol 2,3-dioxygenase-like lactoylglutathione lyase family enzyme|uniref:glyoxalase n=1 Tax=unclassified Pseudomonas TaxID=196821 RepID=UPI0005D3539E|nr:glyoxalase [Pseudomonas sp. ES3-33]KJH74655.1 glyoxalase [Pseudomonas sp. ES3-33]